MPNIGTDIYSLQNRCRKSQCNADEELSRVFKILCSQENDVVRPRTITHLGRDLKFDKTCGQVLFSTFDELCDRVRFCCCCCFVFFSLSRVVVVTLFNAILFRFKISFRLLPPIIKRTHSILHILVQYHFRLAHRSFNILYFRNFSRPIGNYYLLLNFFLSTAL